MASADADQRAASVRGLRPRNDIGEDLGGCQIPPVALVASYLDIERGLLHIGTVVGGLEAHLHPGIDIRCRYRPQRIGHLERRRSDQRLRPSAEIGLMVVAYRVHRQSRASALRRMLRHDDHGINIHSEGLRLAVQTLAVDVHVRDAHHDIVPAPHESRISGGTHVLPVAHAHERRPHIDRREIGFAADDEPRHGTPHAGAGISRLLIDSGLRTNKRMLALLRLYPDTAKHAS